MADIKYKNMLYTFPPLSKGEMQQRNRRYCIIGHNAILTAFASPCMGANNADPKIKYTNSIE